MTHFRKVTAGKLPPNASVKKILELIPLIFDELKRVSVGFFGDKEAGIDGMVHHVEAMQSQIKTLDFCKASKQELEVLRDEFSKCKDCKIPTTQIEDLKKDAGERDKRLTALELLAAEQKSSMRTTVFILSLIWFGSTTITGFIIMWFRG